MPDNVTIVGSFDAGHTSGASIESPVEVEAKFEETPCQNQECRERENIINKIWGEYCLVKDAAKWFRESGNMEMRVPRGGDPMLCLLAAYQDHLGRPLYDSEGNPKPEKDEDESQAVQ